MKDGWKRNDKIEKGGSHAFGLILWIIIVTQIGAELAVRKGSSGVKSNIQKILFGFVHGNDINFVRCK